MTADLIAFLRARLDEEYEAARLVLGTSVMAGLKHGKLAPRWQLHEDGSIRDASDDATLRVKFTWRREADHIARHDPARVLREVEAKRRLIDEFREVGAVPDTPENRARPNWQGDFGYLQGLARAVHLMASAYDGHPDYREEWRP